MNKAGPVSFVMPWRRCLTRFLHCDKLKTRLEHAAASVSSVRTWELLQRPQARSQSSRRWWTRAWSFAQTPASLSAFRNSFPRSQSSGLARSCAWRCRQTSRRVQDQWRRTCLTGRLQAWMRSSSLHRYPATCLPRRKNPKRWMPQSYGMQSIPATWRLSRPSSEGVPAVADLVMLPGILSCGMLSPLTTTASRASSSRPSLLALKTGLRWTRCIIAEATHCCTCYASAAPLTQRPQRYSSGLRHELHLLCFKR
mmetsp:Transcript_21456/g.49985  ORF Transcript_21456/g.49985 Transcript_21456/m.49985 type:complete len:254 (-) Transcript_21456:1210-1971(-)